MIYTGYFANRNKYVKMGLTPFRISNGGKLFKMEVIEDLIPDWKIVDAIKKGDISEDEYIEAYEKQLDQLECEGIMDSIVEFLNMEVNPILLCYESPDKFCHRHILADWLNRNYNLGVTEYLIQRVNEVGKP